ncbi:hypothetical protein FQR65_LT13249 [Abscondita terminalis]|nr:hypothetical protein FQR65_LT13249 [Abscondita terminalis]
MLSLLATGLKVSLSDSSQDGVVELKHFQMEYHEDVCVNGSHSVIALVHTKSETPTQEEVEFPEVEPKLRKYDDDHVDHSYTSPMNFIEAATPEVCVKTETNVNQFKRPVFKCNTCNLSFRNKLVFKKHRVSCHRVTSPETSSANAVKQTNLESTNLDEEIIEETEEAHYSGDLQQNTPSTPESEPLDMFFLSMYQTTMNLARDAQLGVKKNIFKAVTDAEEFMAAIQNDNMSQCPVHSDVTVLDED